jgi:molybdopterin-synthase adenylyltransferase
VPTETSSSSQPVVPSQSDPPSQPDQHSVLNQRMERYKDIIPPERLACLGCSVIGVGAIGRQVAIQLAAMGVPRLQIIDHDVVDEVNLGTQGYFADDVGRPKVDATGDIVHSLNPMLDLQTHQERYAKSMEVLPVVFCCVDSIQTRRHIFDAVHRTSQLFIDARMAAEVLRVLTVTSPLSAARYRGTLFDPSEAHRDGCTSKSTIYCASIAAGIMVGQQARWLRGLPTDTDVSINLLSMELAVV